MQTEELPDGNSVDNPVKNKSTHADVQDKMIQTEVDDSNILTVNKIEIVYFMESWGTQTDVVELEDMSPILPINQGDDASQITLVNVNSDTTEIANADEVIMPAEDTCNEVVKVAHPDIDQANSNSEAESESCLNPECNQEMECESIVREDESDVFAANVNSDNTETVNVDEGIMPAEETSNEVVL